MGVSSRLKGFLYLLVLKIIVVLALSTFVSQTVLADQSSCQNLLRIQTVNTFNLVLKDQREVEHYGTGKKPKKEWQLKGMAEAVKRFNPDILVLQELENESQTMDWNRRYLDDEYEFISSGIRDDRGVLTGFLIKRELFLKYNFEIESHSHETWSAPDLGIIDEPVFKRDLPVLWATHKNGPKTGQKAFAVIGVHLKSKRSYKGDKESERLRTAQIENMIQIANHILDKQGSNFLLLIAGDFNEDILKDKAAQKLFASGYADSVASSTEHLSDEELITFSYIHNGEVKHQKLDGIFLPQSLFGRVQWSMVMTFLDDELWPIGIPRTIKQKLKMPTDHRPVGAVVRLDDED